MMLIQRSNTVGEMAAAVFNPRLVRAKFCKVCDSLQPRLFPVLLQFCERTEDGVRGTNTAAATLYMRPARPGPDTVNVYRPSGSPGPARHVKQCLFSFAVTTAQSAQLNSLPHNE